MWRDIERRAARYGLQPKVPAPYPLAELVLANQVATLGEIEGWVEPYTPATYRRWFEQSDLAGQEPNLSESLTEVGLDPDRILGLTNSEELIGSPASSTAEAIALGVFGSPSFVVGREIFWGDDRLEDAISWAKK